MPTPELEVLLSPTTARYHVGLEPVHNALYSLILLTKADTRSGLDEWVYRSVSAMTPEQRHTNRLVMIGLFYAVAPRRSWADFPTYVDHLQAMEPLELRNRVLDTYLQMASRTNGAGNETRASILASRDDFLRFLLDRFSPDHIDTAIESEAFHYLHDPPAMQTLIVTHLREMWQELLAGEWARVLPLLQASVEAFRQMDFSGLSREQAVRAVTGQDLEECKEDELALSDRIVFVPSTHLGPYVGRFKAGTTLWLLFGARLPEGSPVSAPDLSRAEIRVRLGALADDNRLRILRQLAEQGELSSKEIMAGLELSQSAASRHLTQLSATGYLNERRCEGAKCYSLNSDRIAATLTAVTNYLSGE
jgi:DNA-binding transcriptional ArsR family regulator